MSNLSYFHSIYYKSKWRGISLWEITLITMKMIITILMNAEDRHEFVFATLIEAPTVKERDRDRDSDFICSDN